MLVSIHMIQNHAPSNLNRDGDGSPKNCVFGGVKRARISSQCIKRSIRQSVYFRDELDQYGFGIRSRRLPAEIKKRLQERGLPEDLVAIAVEKVQGIAVSTKNSGDNKSNDQSSKAKRKEPSVPRTNQLLFFTPYEVEFLVDGLYEAATKARNAGEFKKFDLRQYAKGLEHIHITPDMALCGRMSTSDAFVGIEASLQVAHAISTHRMEHEFDFFSAVDDLIDSMGTEEEAGAGIISDTEFTSACFYKFFNIHYDGLVANLANHGKAGQTSDEIEDAARKIILAFLKAAVFTTPTGKQNSFAAFQLPDAVLVEVSDKNVPVSYANAFVEPVRPTKDRDLVQASVDKFKTYMETIVYKYNLGNVERFWFTTKDVVIEGVKQCDTFNALLMELESAMKRKDKQQ